MLRTHLFKVAGTIALALLMALAFSRFSSTMLEREVTEARSVAPNTPTVHPVDIVPSSKTTLALSTSTPVPKSLTQKSTAKAAKGKSPQKIKRTAIKKRPSAKKKWQQVTITGNTLHVSRAHFNHLTTKGLAPILKTARMEPVVHNGKVQGFRLASMSRGSVWEAAGLRKNDLFKTVNGMPLNDAAQAIKVLQNAKRASTIQVEFMRGARMHRKVIVVR